MITIILIATFAYILSKIHIRATTDDTLTALVKETHKYSGIHEDSYSQFYANVQMAREYRRASFMYKAIHHLNEIPLYMSPVDPDVQGEIAELGQKIGVAFESTMIDKAINTNTYFKPKYI